ncbi:MAG: hypothetical protein ABIN01_18400, partial [Ferruginibacter sp.]
GIHHQFLQTRADLKTIVAMTERMFIINGHMTQCREVFFYACLLTALPNSFPKPLALNHAEWLQIVSRNRKNYPAYLMPATHHSVKKPARGILLWS